MILVSVDIGRSGDGAEPDTAGVRLLHRRRIALASRWTLFLPSDKRPIGRLRAAASAVQPLRTDGRSHKAGPQRAGCPDVRPSAEATLGAYGLRTWSDPARGRSLEATGSTR
jgi:hypothetical protein